MGDRIGGVIIVVAFVFIVVLLFNGFWAECTNTSPEFLDWKASR